MNATAELAKMSVKDVIRSIEASDQQAHLIILKQELDNLKLLITNYFKSQPTNYTFKSSFDYLSEPIFNFKMRALPLLTDDPSFKDSLNDDNDINNDIIDIFNNKVHPTELNDSIIKNLELARDTPISAENIPPIEGLEDMIINAVKFGINDIDITGLDTNTQKILFKELDKSKKIYESVLSLDYSYLIYHMLDEKTLVFDSNKLNELTSFNNNAQADFNEIKDDLDVYITMANNISDLLPSLANGSSISNFDELGISIMKVTELRHLEKGWDDEDSMPIDKAYISLAIKIVADLFKHFNKLPTFIAPTIYSGVLLEYASSDDRLDIRIGDELNPIVNYFKSKKLVTARVPYNEDFVKSVWTN